MRVPTRNHRYPITPASAGLIGWTALVLAVLILVVGGGFATLARAQDKPASVMTVLPAVTLGTKQLADIAAKGVPSRPVMAPIPPTATTWNLQAARSSTGLEHFATGEMMARQRHLPAISEALGRIPRERWIREALGKRPDVAVIDGRLVPVVPAGAPR